MIPAVSIIVPVYNSEKYLAECVESILGQTFKDFELILVDDGSTDGSARLCDSLSTKDSRIRVVHQSNAGALIARKTGVENSSSTWVLFSDSDDRMPADALEHLISLDDGTAEIIAGTIRYESLNLTLKTEAVDGAHSAQEYASLILDRKTYYGPCSKLFKRVLYDDMEWLEDKRVFQNEDLLMLVSLVSKVKTYVITDNSHIHYECITRPGSASSRVMSYEGWKLVFQTVEERLRSNSMLKNDILRAYLDYVVWSLNVFCINKRIYFVQDSFVKHIVDMVENSPYADIIDSDYYKLIHNPFLRFVEVSVRRMKFFARKYILR